MTDDNRRALSHKTPVNVASEEHVRIAMYNPKKKKKKGGSGDSRAVD